MGTTFIILGVFITIMTTIVRYVFSKPPNVITSVLLRDALKISLNYKSKDFGSSYFQLVGLIWLFLGIVLQFIPIDYKYMNKYIFMALYFFILGLPLWGLIFLDRFKNK
jgi:hypothetical protein